MTKGAYFGSMYGYRTWGNADDLRGTCCFFSSSTWVDVGAIY